ncbi:PREDICTED: uncharacterized protein LOC109293944 [Gavialis gangeticus]|uniref:uncharacterized protein LOC109293944 n=1 Tax=Gavialis gangeticus TaxID=94835 RepID=UPI00092F8306|nr:PREDICTED: uncharacterized protein LOC109293944 [Gavialis gangeticus]
MGVLGPGLYRVTSANYTARCSSECGGVNGTEMCMTNGSMRASPCALECCSSPLCLQLNATAYGDLPPTTTPAPTTTTSTTSTTKAPPRNPWPPCTSGFSPLLSQGKVCATFSCRGDGCFKGKKPAGRCIVGFDFCEMKKTGSSYVAGCSKACKTGKPVCASGVATTCYQECCPAGPKASCLKLDGHVHVNGAGRRALAPILQLLAGGAVFVLHYCVLAAFQG